MTLHSVLLCVTMWIQTPSLLAYTMPETRHTLPDRFGENIPIHAASSSQTPKTTTKTRRAFWQETTNAVTTAALSVVVSSFPAVAAQEDAVLVAEQPALAYLVPIYNFKDALSVLESQLTLNSRDGLRRASTIVENFLGGGFLSNKNVFRGMCVVYIQEIKYNNMDPYAVAKDKNDRLADCEAAIEGLVKIRKPLQKLLQQEDASSPIPEILQDFQGAKDGINNFLSRIPQKELDNVQRWIRAVGDADVDKNGKLDKNELNSLAEADQEAYKLVGELLGG